MSEVKFYLQKKRLSGISKGIVCLLAIDPYDTDSL